MPTSLSPRFPLQLAVRRRARNGCSRRRRDRPRSRLSSLRECCRSEKSRRSASGRTTRPAGRIVLLDRLIRFSAWSYRSVRPHYSTGRSGRTTRPAGRPVRSAASTGRSVMTGRSTGAATDRLASLESRERAWMARATCSADSDSHTEQGLPGYMIQEKREWAHAREALVGGHCMTAHRPSHIVDNSFDIDGRYNSDPKYIRCRLQVICIMILKFESADNDNN